MRTVHFNVHFLKRCRHQLGAIRYADMLFAGKGMSKNEVEAVKWYRKAAEMGWPFSGRVLASIYYSGELVKKDNVEASKWMHVSLALLAKKRHTDPGVSAQDVATTTRY